MNTVVELRPNKKQRRLAARQAQNQLQRGLDLKYISPLTDNQERTFEAFSRGKNLLLHGSAGTGKSFISLYLSLEEIMEGDGIYNKVVILRSVVPTRDMGFLPGSAKEKAKVYEAPYAAICNELFGRGDAYEILKTKNMIDFQTTSFVRGITLNDCIVLVDEVQNMTYQELDSVITRIGDNCRVVFSGDFKQSDLIRDAERSGLLTFMKILKRMNMFENIEFTKEDIVRSDLVKSYIIAKEAMLSN
jgi:phosphate starvation-inducible protein PhoH and related proteins